MEEMVKKDAQLPVVLEGLARQGQMFLSSAAMNLMQYGRVLCEAKILVPRGQFEKWVKENFQMSERTAQQYMAVWKRFGGKTGFETVKFSSLSKMLALPEGKEEDFAKENDLEEMTAREVDRAVKAALEAQRVKTQVDRAALEERVRRETIALSAEEIRNARAERDEAKGELAKIIQDRSGQSAREKELLGQLEQANSRAEKAEAREEEALAQAADAGQEAEDLRAALEETQAGYEQLQSELLDAKSSLARGDADREVSGSLSLGEFGAAVRSFLGAVSQMPYMGGWFAEITEGMELRQWDESLRAVEDWAARSRKALETIEGGIVHG